MASDTNDSGLYDELMAAVPSGVQVLTLRDDGGNPRGMTVSSLTPVSADPPSVLICITGGASMRPTLTEGRSVCLNMLGPDQAAQSMGFAFGEDDPFAVFGWSEGHGGLPILDGCAARLLGRIERVVEHNGNAVTFIQLTGGEVSEQGTLVYWHRTYFRDLVPVEPTTAGRW